MDPTSIDQRLHTRFCDLVGVRYPIVQTGMGWVSGSRLTAATAQAGGLGIIAAAPMTFDQMATAIAEVRAATDAPFGVNLRTDAADVDQRVDHLIADVTTKEVHAKHHALLCSADQFQPLPEHFALVHQGN